MNRLADISYLRLTIGYIVRTFGAVCDKPFASCVTFTSIATKAEEVTQGSLFVPSCPLSAPAPLFEAEEAGAYGIGLEKGEEKAGLDLDIPIIYMDNWRENLGLIASFLMGDPSLKMAVFACFGMDAKPVAPILSQLLHILGNPVCLLDFENSFIQERPLDLSYPLDAVDVQKAEAEAVEEGCSAMVISANPSTLSRLALTGTHVDVCTGSRVLNLVSKPGSPRALQPQEEPLYGSVFDTSTRVVAYAKDPFDVLDKDAFNQLIDVVPMGRASVRTAISMALSAGITTASIRKAISISGSFPQEPGDREKEQDRPGEGHDKDES
ncbi:MAG: hypothetical protein IKS61_01145 [Aeriscardovia sp.]|nr:hypothetical protein [Aeriscardovia sp.]